MDKWTEIKKYINRSIELLNEMSNSSRIDRKESIKLLNRSYGMELVLMQMEKLERNE